MRQAGNDNDNRRVALPSAILIGCTEAKTYVVSA